MTAMKRAIVLLSLLWAVGCGDSSPSPTTTSGSGGSGGEGGGTVTPDPLTVETEYGTVVGTTLDDAHAWLGIPFAAPAMGDLRWRPPQPPEAWDVPLDAGAVGPSCIQIDFLSGEVVDGGSEDCLSLNVYAPASGAEALPVMVWIHGGAFEVGAGDGTVSAEYSGRHLAAAGDVVVVNFNYRLGPLGFLRHPDLSDEDPRGTSGNYGLEDQRFALEWVQRNVAAFGGDPGNVTIFGESAGGSSVCMHMVSPDSDGLFHKAIVQSGVCHQDQLAGGADAQGQALADAIGCAGVGIAACLRDTSPSALLTALPNSSDIFDPNNTSWGPNVDGVILPSAMLPLFQSGSFSQVPVMLGTTKDEAALFLALAGMQMLDESAYQTALTQAATASGKSAMELEAQYPSSDYPTPFWALSTLWTESLFSCPARSMARAVSSAGVATYLYHFVYAPPFPQLGDIGAFHTAELAFVFRTSSLGFVPLDESELPLSDAMIGLWSRFARSGDPNGGGDDWPTFHTMSDQHLEIDLGSAAASSGLRRDNCDFWD